MRSRHENQLCPLRPDAEADGRRFRCLPNQDQRGFHKLEFCLIRLGAQLTPPWPVPRDQRAARAGLRQHAIRGSRTARKGAADQVLDSRSPPAITTKDFLLSDPWQRGYSNTVRLHCHWMWSRPTASPGQLRCRCPTKLEVLAQMRSNCCHGLAQERRIRIRYRSDLGGHYLYEAALHSQALFGDGLSKAGVYFYQPYPTLMEPRRRWWKRRCLGLGGTSECHGSISKLRLKNAWLYDRTSPMNFPDAIFSLIKI
mgnify:CR=1 FL=1